MGAESKLTENFCCVKCRGKVAKVRTTRLPVSGLRELLREGEGAAKYYTVTCGLCGYTELYDARVYAVQDETLAKKSPIPQES
jgi:predicted nucleic-acid-binding Zn-ribbon protein